MFLPYSYKTNEDGSYSFISNYNSHYLIYFAESEIVDVDNNAHILYNIGFIRDGKHNCIPFKFQYDGRISATIISVVKDFFEKNDHRTLIYFCFGDDGYSRHRKIVFDRWSKSLDLPVQKFDNTIRYEKNVIYESLLIMKENPLKNLIINSFNHYLKDMEELK